MTASWWRAPGWHCRRRVVGRAGAAIGPGPLQVEAALAPVVPADFAAGAPPFAPLAAVQALVALTATAELWPN